MRDGFQDVDRVLCQGVESESFPGAVLVVGFQGILVYEEAIGQAALIPSPRPMTLDTRFDLASLTKPIATTTALMLLLESGRIELDAPINAYLDTWCRPACDTPTLRQLIARARVPAP